MLKEWFQHAFAVDATPDEPSAEQLAVMDKLCREVVRRRLTPAAVAFLELSRPLNCIGSQTLHFFSPLISALATGDEHLHLAAFLERRDAIDRVCERIECLEQAACASAVEGSTGSAGPDTEASAVATLDD